MDLSFGTKLRLERERQQVALAAISQQTKIKMSLLEGLERDDVSHWPDGIFRRAYVRAYAQAIGLEPDDVVREFLVLYPCSDVEPAAPGLPDEINDRRQPPTRLRVLISSAIAAIPVLQRNEKREPAPAVAPPAPRQAGAKPHVRQPLDRLTFEPVSSDDTETTIDRAYTDFELPMELAPCPPVEIFPDLAEDTLSLRQQDGQVVSCEQAAFDSPVARVEIDPVAPQPDLAAMASLCTALGRVADFTEVEDLLADAAEILGAVGLIVWSWDARTAVLRPLMAHGYSRAVLAQLPEVRPDANNAVGAVFRTSEHRIVDGDRHPTGAVVVPLIASTGCVGALALELNNGAERHEDVRALAMILAAQLVILVGCVSLADAVNA